MRDPTFRAVLALVKTLEQLDEEKFAKLMAYPRGPVSRRVRTNNHVERTNRTFRFLEKAAVQVATPADRGAAHGVDARCHLDCTLPKSS